MLRKILVALKWAIGVLGGICAVLYVLTVVINWHDADASSAALRMAEYHRKRPPARDEDNAYVYTLGFGVAPGDDPLAMGRKRLAWLQRAEKSHVLVLGLDPLGTPFDAEATRHASVQKYLDSCGPRDPGCSTIFESARLTFDTWNSSESWMLERYQTLLNFGSWREFVSRHFYAPLPPYAAVSDGQKLLFLHARIRAANGDAPGVNELLAEDLRFWRRALESSDGIMSKMVATASILRHFKLGAEIVSALPPALVQEAVPAEWRVAMTDPERSIWRCMTGEWIREYGLIRNLESELADSLPTGDSLVDRVLESLSGPFFQPQDTINLLAEQYTLAAQLIEGVPMARYEEATARITELSDAATREAFPPRSLYNIPGRILIGYGPDLGSYARRVGDLEGVRQAALAAVNLHEESIAPKNIPAALARSQFRNPYDGRPFDWDAADGAVVFRGLEAGERGEHRIH